MGTYDGEVKLKLFTHERKPISVITDTIRKTNRVFFSAVLLQLLVVVGLIYWWGYLLLSKTEAPYPNLMVWTEGLWVVGVLLAAAVLLFRMFNKELTRRRTLQTFFASLSHQLRTPIASLKTQAQNLRDALSDGDLNYSNRVLERLTRDVDRLQTSLENSLQLARLEDAAVLSLSIRVEDVLQSVVTEFKEIYGEKINFEVTYAKDDSGKGFTIKGDEFFLKTIFRNIFENAIKHSGQPTARLIIHFQTNESKLEVRLQDKGQGAQLDRMGQLGDLFVKSRQSKGSGLGLYLVKGLSQKMKGSVVFFNTEQGFCVELSFPLIERNL